MNKYYYERLVNLGIADSSVAMGTYTLGGKEADATGVSGQELLDEAARMAEFDADFD